MEYKSLQIVLAMLFAVALGACHSSGSSSDDDDDVVTPPVEVTPGPTAAGEVILSANGSKFATILERV